MRYHKRAAKHHGHAPPEEEEMDERDKTASKKAREYEDDEDTLWTDGSKLEGLRLIRKRKRISPTHR